jgi:hypothetical protein
MRLYDKILTEAEAEREAHQAAKRLHEQREAQEAGFESIEDHHEHIRELRKMAAIGHE